MRVAALLLVGPAVAGFAQQTPEKKVYLNRGGDAALLRAAGVLREAGKLVDPAPLLPQLARTRCKLALPPPRTAPASGRAIWELARQSYLRVGWYYLCSKCDHWHANVAGGYALTADGAAATCHHVVEKPEHYEKGYLIAVNDAGDILPVTEILAADARADVCILRVRAAGELKPLPLADTALPGDIAYCFSDPMGFRGYFSQGMVNRYYKELPRRLVARGESPPGEAPLSMNVSTDWAPGSSGAAVLDQCGNAIGHVARIQPVEEQPRKRGETAAKQDTGTYMVLHNAVPASEVLRLIER